MSVGITSGISTSTVSSTLDVTLGASATFGSGTHITSPAIPSGYMGRIACRVDYDRYLFDDAITYYRHGTAWEDNYSETITKTNQLVEGPPRNPFFYLELKAK